mmetsp:Transcript_40612/g.73111  ORF Transcript_40612/g.73111 Transcript_40612/m.73111 type:complete len:323 (+) Transcript_40612:60-1028(+)
MFCTCWPPDVTENEIITKKSPDITSEDLQLSATSNAEIQSSISNKEAEKAIEDNTSPASQKGDVVEVKGSDADRQPDEPWQDWTSRVMLGRAKMVNPPLGKRRPSTEGLTLEQYVAKHDQGWNQLLAMDSMEGWSLNREVEGTEIYTKQDPDKPFSNFKAICMLEAREGIHELVAGLSNAQNRKHWDEMFLDSEKLEEHSPYYRVNYTQIEAQSLLTSRRDLCLIGRVRWEKDGSCLMLIEDSDDPALNMGRPGFVRAKMLIGGYIIRPTEKPEIFKVTWTGCIDPGGWIPTAIANLVAWKQGITLRKYAKWAEETKQKTKK